MSTTTNTKPLFEFARDYAEKGLSYAHEGLVLRDYQKLCGIEDLESEQKLLEEWHRLFAEGKLAWGYNVYNPSAPFFHVPKS